MHLQPKKFQARAREKSGDDEAGTTRHESNALFPTKRERRRPPPTFTPFRALTRTKLPQTTQPPDTMLRPRLRIPLRPRLSTPARSTLLPLAMACQTRSLHALVPLEYNLKNQASDHGIGQLLGRDAFNIAWTQYQTHLLERLNVMIAGMSTRDL
jgi:hypothetical protein